MPNDIMGHDITSEVAWLLLPLAFHMVGRGERLGIIVYEHVSHDLHPSNLTLSKEPF